MYRVGSRVSTRVGPRATLGTRVSRSIVLLSTVLLACPAPAPTSGDGKPATPPPLQGDKDTPAQGDKDTPGTKPQQRATSPTPGRDPSVVREKGNHLVGEPSPYLEQHAHNPVDWYPWGKEALGRAERENKPIFVSIGYSTCHWCHVMEEESFEDDEVAKYLNDHFIAIKVDREQRPDLDALYIDAVASMGGSTGWPLTIFLTPKLEPYFGGTYFPREGRGGRPGFLDVLQQVREQYATDGEAVAGKGREVLAKVQKQALGKPGNRSKLGISLVDQAMQALARARDPEYGGFGSRQKFPNTPLLLAELRHTIRTGNADSRAHLVLTLEQILAGGIRDHLAGSFHRYAVDHRWHLPHFEKMLYDNAQLAGLLVEAGQALEREDFVAAGRAVLDDLIATWQQPDGGFVVGFDADDPGGEGAYYSWTLAELDAALGETDAKVFAAAFGVTAAGDREIEGRSVLHRKPDEDVGRTLGLDASEVAATIERSLPKLAEVRAKRPPPATDDKELVAWNGLAIMALADAGRWLDEPRYVDAASKAGAWVLDTCFVDGTMSRGVRRGERLGSGFLDDYALAGLGMVRLHAATGELRWLTAARQIAKAIEERFYDAEQHTFMRTAAGDDVPLRLADLEDGVMPSGGTAAILLALELGAIAGDRKLYDLGLDVLERTARRAATRPFSAGFLLVAVEHATAPVREVVLAGSPNSPKTAALWKQIAPTTHARVLPVRLPADGASPTLVEAFPALLGKKARKADATAYVCEQGSCAAPTSDPATLKQQLDAAAPS